MLNNKRNDMVDLHLRKISELMIKLQAQDKLPLWSIAHEKLIFSSAINQAHSWGPKTKYLYYLIRYSSKLKAANLVLFSVGCLKAFLIWWQVKMSAPKQSTHAPQRIFAGFGASSEEYLFLEYTKRENDTPLKINWVTHQGLAELGCPNFFSIIYTIFKNASGYHARLKTSLEEISTNDINFLTVCALNIGEYSFYRRYWDLVKKIGSKELAIIAPAMAAFAAIDSKLNTVFLQHGLLALSIPIPQFDRIEVLTDDEKKYFTKMLPDIAVTKTTEQAIYNKDVKNNIVFVLSPNTFNEAIGENKEPMIEFVTWAKEKGMSIVLRPTLKATKNDIENLNHHFLDATIDDCTRPLADSIAKWQPKFVLSWRSTGLATALDYGCLPVSLLDPNALNGSWNMIYPMRQRVLFWPQDKVKIEVLINYNDIYEKELKYLGRTSEVIPSIE